MESIIAPQQWCQIMSYIREVPGTVYEEQIRDLLSADEKLENFDGDIVDFLNSNAPADGAYGARLYLKKDEVTGGIYTIPSQREYSDPLLHSQKELCFRYNSYLYKDEYTPGSSAENKIDLSTEEGIQEVLADDRIITLHNGVLNITFEDGSLVKDFKLQDVIKILNKQDRILQIGSIIANGVTFEGKTSLVFGGDRREAPTITGGLYFDRAVFSGDLEMRNIVFDFDNSPKKVVANAVDFRNARFFGKVMFRDVQFIGSEAGAELSFEDARIQHTIEIINTSFKRTRLNYFQTIFGHFIDFVGSVQSITTSGNHNNGIKLANVSFSDVDSIDFSDAEINSGKIIFQNITDLPLTKLCLSPIIDKNGKTQCPDCILEINNCEITRSLYIGNVSELTFKNSKNFGKIISADNWGAFSKNHIRKTKGLFGSSVGGTIISSPLLLAVYNYGLTQKDNVPTDINRNKANDFLILKECFASEGAYDDEDDAFILYMEFRPYSIWYNRNRNNLEKLEKAKRGEEKQKAEKQSYLHRILYQCLYDTGKYGISPGRVILALAILVFTFSFIYWFLTVKYGTNAFSIGSTYNYQFNYANVLIQNMDGKFSWSKLWVSFLFSLEGVIPFVSQFEPIHWSVCLLSAIENAIGSFLVGYFSVAVIRKTLR